MSCEVWQDIVAPALQASTQPVDTAVLREQRREDLQLLLVDERPGLPRRRLLILLDECDSFFEADVPDCTEKSSPAWPG